MYNCYVYKEERTINPLHYGIKCFPQTLVYWISIIFLS